MGNVTDFTKLTIQQLIDYTFIPGNCPLKHWESDTRQLRTARKMLARRIQELIDMGDSVDIENLSLHELILMFRRSGKDMFKEQESDYFARLRAELRRKTFILLDSLE